MSYSQFDIDAALRQWQAKMDQQKAEALASGLWQGKEDQLSIQLELGQMLGVVTAATMRARNEGTLTIGQIAGTIGLSIGSVLFFVQKNLGDQAMLRTVREMERSLDIHTSGNVPNDGLIARHSIHPVEGGRA